MLGDLIGEITTEASTRFDNDSAVNIGFTYAGLESLSLTAATLASFSEEFREGMASRAGKLGDVDEHAPENWENGLGHPESLNKLHCFVAVHAASPAKVAERFQTIQARIERRDATLQYSIDALISADLREHFGFRDGLGDTAVIGGDVAAEDGHGLPLPGGGWRGIAPGEFLFGHSNEQGVLANGPQPAELADDGTYLVVRKLHQKVAQFRSYLQRKAVDLNVDPEWLVAKLVGRWRDGTPLELSPDRPWGVAAVETRIRERNSFRYAQDSEGLHVPRGSHIRRVNPRDGLPQGIDFVRGHRILRRGLPYGPELQQGTTEDDGVDRGVFFMAMNTRIAHQFEFIQSDWIQSGSFAELGSADKDPIIGSSGEMGMFSIPMPDGTKKRLFGLPTFTRLRFGAYVFIPSVRGLRWIASEGVEAVPQSRRVGFESIAVESTSLEAASITGVPAMSFSEYLVKKLESWNSQTERGDLAAEIMADVSSGVAGVNPDGPALVQAILGTLAQNPKVVFAVLRQAKPVLVLPGFAIVTRFADVREVLQQDSVFRVIYRERMEKVTGGDNFFLGMEDSPRYQRDVSNMRIVVRREDVAQRIAGFIEREAEKLVTQAGGRIEVVKDLGRLVPTRWIANYFGIPTPDERLFGEQATVIFRYLFVPTTPPDIEQKALAAAAALRLHIDRTIQSRKAERRRHDDVLERCLQLQDAQLPGFDDLTIRNNLIGLLVGAVNTTATAVSKTLDELLRRPDAMEGAKAAAKAGEVALVAKYVYEAMRFNPLGPGLFRLAADDYVLAKGQPHATKIPRGTMVLAATQSAMQDELEIDAVLVAGEA